MKVIGNIGRLIGDIEPEEGAELMEAIQKPAFAIKDMHIMHQYMHHWREQKLLWTDTRGRKGKQYTFLDYVWIKMVERLRDFGMPFETIRAFKKGMQNPVSFEDFKEMILRSMGLPHVQKRLDQLPEIYREGLQHLLDMDTQEVEGSDEWDDNIFSIYLKGALMRKTHIAFLINRKGECLPFTGADTSSYFKEPAAREFLKHSYMSLSLTEIIQEIIEEQDMDFLLERVEVISQDERQVIDLIRQGELSKLTVRFSKDNSIELIEATRTQAVDVTSRFIDIITHQGYQDIEFKTQQGKVVQFSNTTKYKPEKTGS